MKKKIVTILMTAAIGTSLLAGQAVMAADTEQRQKPKQMIPGIPKKQKKKKQSVKTGNR